MNLPTFGPARGPKGFLSTRPSTIMAMRDPRKERTFRKMGPLIASGRQSEIFAWGDNQVLKLLNDHYDASAARDEAEITSAAYRAGLPAPRVDGVMEVEGRHGIILERIEGPSMLRRIVSRPWTVLRSARLLAELHVEMHAKPASGLPPQQDLLERKIRAAKGISDLTRATALDVLARLSNDSAVCHGDFHPDNVIMSSRGPITIDWQLATRGTPLADVACTSALLLTADLPSDKGWHRLVEASRRLFDRYYLGRYLQLCRIAHSEFNAWLLAYATASLSESVSVTEERKIRALIEGPLLRRVLGSEANPGRRS